MTRPGRAARAAPFWRRLLADLLDLAVVGGALAALWFAGVLRPQLPPMGPDWLDHLALVFGEHAAVLRGPVVLTVGLGTVYGMVLRGVLGRTLGEAALGLVLVDRQGFAPGPLHTLGHALFSAVGLALLGLGYVWAAVDPNRQGWAEYLSATRLVHGRPFPDRPD
ncbi:MAG: RDD family protein [Myxococcales bacterium]|nr:RDD family protein [Myxococcales bacterium]